MDSARAAQALATASSSLTRTFDVAGALTVLMDGCCESLAVDAVGILVESAGTLELLAASSHDAVELEVHQLNADEGPCVDAHLTGTSVEVASPADVGARWPKYSRTMLGAGFASVRATPLVWHDDVFGAIGMFRRSGDAFTSDEKVVVQAFADIATMLVVHLDEVRPEQLVHRLELALAGRVVIEQAKGVLADRFDLSMADAYTALVRAARSADEPLTKWAARVVLEAHSPQA